MGQGVVHVLHVHCIVLLVPDAVLPGEQIREELKETTNTDGVTVAQKAQSLLILSWRLRSQARRL